MNKRKAKKAIPKKSIYCYNNKGYCPHWKNLSCREDVVLLREKYCDYREHCNQKCNDCDELVTYCSYCKVYEVGQFPLGDMCKICNVSCEFGN